MKLGEADSTFDGSAIHVLMLNLNRHSGCRIGFEGQVPRHALAPSLESRPSHHPSPPDHPSSVPRPPEITKHHTTRRGKGRIMQNVPRGGNQSIYHVLS